MMSKEIKHDRCDFLGSGVNEHCSTHSGEYTATRNSRISRLLLLGLLVAIICAGIPGTQGQSGDSSTSPGAALDAAHASAQSVFPATSVLPRLKPTARP